MLRMMFQWMDSCVWDIYKNAVISWQSLSTFTMLNCSGTLGLLKSFSETELNTAQYRNFTERETLGFWSNTMPIISSQTFTAEDGMLLLESSCVSLSVKFHWYSMWCLIQFPYNVRVFKCFFVVSRHLNLITKCIYYRFRVNLHNV